MGIDDGDVNAKSDEVMSEGYIEIFADGEDFFVVRPDFVDLQESQAVIIPHSHPLYNKIRNWFFDLELWHKKADVDYGDE